MSSARLDRSAGGTTPGGVQNRDTTPRTVDPKSHLGPIPVVERDLVDHLRLRFPVVLSRGRDPRDYDVLVGQHEVIDYLERLWREQNT